MPKCHRPFSKKEDESKEKDLGSRPAKREFTSKILKTRDETIVKEIKDFKKWPRRYVQRFFYCKNCGHGEHGGWHDSDKGVPKNWEKDAEWHEFLKKHKPVEVYVKKNKDGEYVPISKKNAKGNNKTLNNTNKLVSIINFLESKSYSDVANENEFEKIVVTLLKNNSHKVLRQKSKGRFRPDILVDDKYPIELKLVENSIKPLQRLIGQIDDYKTEHKEVGVFILVSQSSTLLQYIGDKVKELNKKSGVFAVSKISEIKRKVKSRS